MDDFELEVTDLRTGETLRREAARQPEGAESGDARPSSPASEHASVAGGDYERPPLHNMSERPRRARARFWRIPETRRRVGSVAALLAVALALLVALGGMRNAPRSLAILLRLPAPAATPTDTAGDNLIALRDGVPWGTLLIDNHVMTRANAYLTTQQAMTVGPGRHTLEYRAAPFPLLRCTFSVPAASSDTCHLGESMTIFNVVNTVRTFDLEALPERLPRPQLLALQRAVSARLGMPSAPVTLEPGDHYLAANGTVMSAPTALLARQDLLLDGQGNVQIGDDPLYRCVTLCPAFASPGRSGWVIAARVTPEWQITAPDGQVVSPRATPASALHLDAPLVVDVTARWQSATGTWSVDPWVIAPDGRHVSQVSTDCELLSLLLNDEIQSTLASGQRSMTFANPTGENGCVVGVFPVNGQPATASGISYYLYRFGVLLAANQTAHVLAPDLPLASAHEQATAKQWVNQQEMGAGGASGGGSAPMR